MALPPNVACSILNINKSIPFSTYDATVMENKINYFPCDTILFSENILIKKYPIITLYNVGYSKDLGVCLKKYPSLMCG